MEKHVAYWISQSDDDLVVAESMLEKGHYTWSLFIGHLVLEKLLKAIYVREFAEDYLRRIKEMRAWLKKQIEK